LQLAFGAAAARIPVMATKGQHGHALGATGAWEAALTLLAMRDGIVPRIVNCDDPDPACPLALVRAPLHVRARTAVSSSAGFGGINAALAFAGVDS
jgi:3-oxoacyl-[acyl-carrier-protein] synthase II